MRIIIKTKVQGAVIEVFRTFDRELFEYLLPKNAVVEKYGGSKKGSIVHLSFKFPKTEWISKIVDYHENGDYSYFVDRGVQLPFGLKKWRHKHIVCTQPEGTYIIEDIFYKTNSLFLDLIVYPLIFIVFSPRKWQYRRYFDKKMAESAS